jgi:hypothetical protein
MCRNDNNLGGITTFQVLRGIQERVDILNDVVLRRCHDLAINIKKMQGAIQDRKTYHQETNLALDISDQRQSHTGLIASSNLFANLMTLAMNQREIHLQTVGQGSNTTIRMEKRNTQ